MSVKLQNRDFTVVIDRSGSMLTSDTSSGTRWKAAKEGTFALASKAAEFDPDGLTLYLFGSKFKRFENVTASLVNQTFDEFEPAGSTNLSDTLNDIFTNYFARKQAGQAKDGEVVLVVTDGTPNNPGAVVDSIVSATQKLESATEFGISFVQVGKDRDASTFLKKLDDDLTSKGAKFDIVDTIAIDDIGDQPLSEVLLNALVD
jgi:Mg-chelatase subunit ChlD